MYFNEHYMALYKNLFHINTIWFIINFDFKFILVNVYIYLQSSNLLDIYLNPYL